MTISFGGYFKINKADDVCISKVLALDELVEQNSIISSYRWSRVLTRPHEKTAS
jgi:hypothetical protein